MHNVYLKLAALNLASPNDEVELSATTILTFKCSDPVVHAFTPQKLSQDLRAARVVAKRGPGCRIDVDVERDGVVVDEELAGILKESLGLVISRASVRSPLQSTPIMLNSKLTRPCSGGHNSLSVPCCTGCQSFS